MVKERKKRQSPDSVDSSQISVRKNKAKDPKGIYYNFRKNYVPLTDKVVHPPKGKVKTVEEAETDEVFENLHEPDLVDSPRSESPELGKDEILSIISNSQDAPPHLILESNFQRFGMIFAASFGFTSLLKIPQLCIKYGGVSFFLLYSLIMLFISIPLAYIELSLGQYASLPPLQLFSRRTPILRGLGFLLTFVRVVVIYTVFDDFMFQDVINAVSLGIKDTTENETWTNCGPPTNFLNCYDRNLTCPTDENVTYYQYLGDCHPIIVNGRVNSRYTFEQAVVLMTYAFPALRETPVETVLHESLDSFPNLIVVTSVLISLSFMMFFAVYGIQKFAMLCAICSILTIVILAINSGYTTYIYGTEAFSEYFFLNSESLSNPDFYVETFTAVLISTGVADGTLILIGSFTTFRNNIRKDLLFIGVSNIITIFLTFGAIAPSFTQFVNTKYPEAKTSQFSGISAELMDETSRFNFHYQMLDMNSGNPVSLVISTVLSFNLAVMQICPQVITAELIIKSIMNSSRHLRHVDVKTVMVFFYSMFTIFTFFASIIRDWTRGNVPIQRFFIAMVTTCIVPAVVVIQSIFFIYPYSAKRLLTNIYTMKRCWESDSRYGFVSPTNTFWTFAWKFLVPLTSLIFFSLCQYHMIRVYIQEESSDSIRKLHLAIYLLTLLILIIIIPVVGITQVRKAKQLGQHFGTLWDPSPQWGPLLQQDRKRAEFDERANRVRS